MDKAPQRKRFVYKAVIGQNQKSKITNGNNNQTDKFSDFPDNFDDFLSQPSKKLKLDKKLVKKDNILDELLDDDFDFNEAANEINEIEITASQQVSTQLNPSKRPNNIILNNINKSTLSLKIPKNNSLVTKSSLLSPLRPPLSKNIQPTTSKTSLSSQIQTDGNAMINNNQQSAVKHQQSAVKHQQSAVKYQQVIEEYKDKLIESEKKYLSKDGEIKILRETLRKQNEEDFKHRDKITELQHQLKTQQSEKEENLVKEVEKLKTQLQFKTKEVEDGIAKEKSLTAAAHLNKMQKPSTARNSFPAGGFLKSPPKATKVINKNKKNVVSKKLRAIVKNVNLNINNSYLMKRFVSTDINVEHFKCNHDTMQMQTNLPTEQLFMTNLSNHLQLLLQGPSFYYQYIQKIFSYLSNLCEILPHVTLNNNSVVEPSKVDEINHDRICCQCAEKYKVGVLSLMVTSQVCHCDEAFRKYVLQRCSTKTKRNTNVNKERRKEIHGENCYYRKSDSELLVKSMEHMMFTHDKKIQTNDDNEVDFPNVLLQLVQASSHISLIQDEVFSLLVSLSIDMDVAEANSLVRLLNFHKYLSLYITPDVSTDQLIKCVSLLIGCSLSNNIATLLCTKSAQCPLLIIYTNLLNRSDTSKELLSKVVAFLSSFIAIKQKHAYQLLLDSKCQCSNELIECLIIVLFDEYKHLEKLNYVSLDQSSSTRMLAYRQGMTLLSLLCTHEKALMDKKAAVESQFSYLLSGTIKLYRNIPSVNEAEGKNHSFHIYCLVP